MKIYMIDNFLQENGVGEINLFDIKRDGLEKALK